MMPRHGLGTTRTHHRYNGDTDFAHKNEVFDIDIQVSDMDTFPKLKCLCNIGWTNHKVAIGLFPFFLLYGGAHTLES